MKLLIELAKSQEKFPNLCSRQCPYLGNNCLLTHFRCYLFNKNICKKTKEEKRLPECLAAEIKE
jgi:hypothetical protein